MHNKLLLADGAVMVTGGRNIENTYYNHSAELNFKDRDVLAIGPVTAAAGRLFDDFWGYRFTIPSGDLVDVRAALRRNTFKRFASRADYDFGGFFEELAGKTDASEAAAVRIAGRLRRVGRVRLLADRPGKNSSRWLGGQGRSARELTAVLKEARRSIIIQSPYLVLSHPGRRLLLALRRRSPGLRVIISSNSFASTDNILAYSANYRLRADYIEGLGLDIREYKPQPADLLRVFPQHPAMAERAAKRIAANRQSRSPFLCIHAKSLVVDDRLAYVGSYNLDPRSENLNTEIGLLIDDAGAAAELKADILNDARAGNSWVIAKRPMPLGIGTLNQLVDKVLGLSPIDLWPIQNTTSYDLVPGMAEVPPDDPAFHRHYRDAGPFPGAEGPLSAKEITTRIYKAVGPIVTPVL
jgi:phosphatidylserine/phosphatidylglycerophosphate/cardiolipin synthase-like enzyme